MTKESDLSKWHKTILSLRSENQKLKDLLENANANSLGYASLANDYLGENQKLRNEIAQLKETIERMAEKSWRTQ